MTRNENIEKALQEMGIQSLTPMQKEVCETVLAGKDIVLLSPTGSGKSLAYLLPYLQTVALQEKKKHFPTCLILTPTRELALQTSRVIRSVLKYTEGIRTSVLTGGVDIQRQIQSFKNGSDIVVATPKRLLDHIRRHTFKSQMLQYVVIDEADEMLKMGFVDDVKKVINALPTHQTLLCSATGANELTSFLTSPSILTYRSGEKLQQNTQVTFIKLHENQKLDCLKTLLKNKLKTVVFTNTKKTCAFVKEHLPQAKAIYSGTDMQERKKTLDAFINDEFSVLVATDVFSRGMDIPSVLQVILFDYPDHTDNLIHRLGRTSRKMTRGKAYVFVTKGDWVPYDCLSELLPYAAIQKTTFR